jgi:MioC protein
MPNKVQILVGTVMGTAEAVALALKAEIEALGHTVELVEQYAHGDIARNAEAIKLICCSNTGSGDVPDTLAPLLEEFSAAPPAIAGTRYALINLGDSCYLSFGEAGEAIAEALNDLGAEALMDVMTIDASEIDEPVEHVLREWWPQFKTHLERLS